MIGLTSLIIRKSDWFKILEQFWCFFLFYLLVFVVVVVGCGGISNMPDCPIVQRRNLWILTLRESDFLVAVSGFGSCSRFRIPNLTQFLSVKLLRFMTIQKINCRLLYLGIFNHRITNSVIYCQKFGCFTKSFGIFSDSKFILEWKLNHHWQLMLSHNKWNLCSKISTKIIASIITSSFSIIITRITPHTLLFKTFFTIIPTWFYYSSWWTTLKSNLNSNWIAIVSCNYFEFAMQVKHNFDNFRC